MVRAQRRYGLTAAVAAAGLAAAAAAASAAPVVSGPATCLRPGQATTGQLISPALVVHGAGFTPGGAVRLTRGLREVAGAADARGAFRASLSVIDLIDSRVPAVRTLAVSATDLGGPGARASNRIRVRVAPLAFSVTPERAAPSARVLFRFSGFVPRARIHAHYVFRGRVRASRPMAIAGGPCGTAAVRRPQFPMRRPAVGAWRVQFDHAARYRPRTRPRVVADIEVYPAR